MATGKALNGKPYAGNPHVRFDEGEVASAATPRRGSLLYRKIICALALVGAAFLARATEPAALTLALQGNNVVVTVPANNTLYDTSRLYLVWDGVDHGADLSAWPAAKRMQYDGTISTAASTCQFSTNGIPAGSIVRAIATSDVRLINSWVKIAGNQYIDTGIPDNVTFGVDFKFRPLSASTGGMYGSVLSSGVDQFTIAMYNSHNNYYLRYGGNGATGQGDPYNPAFVLSDLTVAHEIRIFGGTAYLDGVQTLTKLNEGTQAKKCNGAVGGYGHSILLGTSWARNTGNALSGRYCHCEWYYASLLNSSGAPIVNLVPALRGGDLPL